MYIRIKMTLPFQRKRTSIKHLLERRQSQARRMLAETEAGGYHVVQELSWNWSAQVPMPLLLSYISGKGMYQFTVTKWPTENVLLAKNTPPPKKRVTSSQQRRYVILKFRNGIFSLVSCFSNELTSKIEAISDKGLKICVWHTFISDMSLWLRFSPCTKLRTSCHATRV